MKRAFKLKWILSGAAVLLLAVYFVIPDSAVTGDELKYEKLWGQLKWAKRFDRLQKWCPKPVGNVLHLSALKYSALEKTGRLQRELRASGFFAEYEVVVTNLPAGMTDQGRMFQEVFRRVSVLEKNRVFWTFNMPSNHFVFTCRPQDLTLIQRTANQP